MIGGDDEAVLLPVDTRSPDRYLRLRTMLERGRPALLTEESLLEGLVPHLPPIDPAFPAPTSADGDVYRSVGRLIEPLARDPVVVCARTAAEMVVPLWLRWSADKPELAERDVPVQALAILREAVQAERAYDGRILDALQACGEAASAKRAWSAAAAVRAVLSAYRAATERLYSVSGRRALSCRGLAAGAVDYACTAWEEHTVPNGTRQAEHRARDQWLALWWDNCRCRLAIRDVMTARLE